MMRRHRAAQRLNAQRKRRHVQQQHLFGGLRSAGKNVGLHGRTQRDHFVRIQFDVRLLAARARWKRSSTSLRTAGMRVDPPTSTTSSICSGVTPASASACLQGPAVRLSTGSINCSKTSRGISR